MRIVITHRFAFAGFRGASFADNILGSPSFFEAPDMDFSDGSNDDSILGGNPNDDGSGTDPDEPGGNDGPLGGEPANFKITNTMNDTKVFVYRFVKNGSLVSGSRRFKLAYNEQSDVDVSMGGNDAVRFRVINYNTSITDLDQYTWNDAIDISWKINDSSTPVLDVAITDGETFTARYDNLNNYATLS